MAVVGWVGLGKLGAPCAATLAHYGSHEVVGYDVRGADATYPWDGLPPVDLAHSVRQVVAATDNVVFVAVQTPHSRAYGGDQPLVGSIVDFEYQYLVNAVREICSEALSLGKSITLVVVSTVLPGTFDRYLRPLLNEYVTPVYHPFFIAMGTVVEDYRFPEMTLFGVDRHDDVLPVKDVYETLYDRVKWRAPVVSIPSAELTKVAYNTFITSKIVFANTLMELAEHTGADVDEVTETLAQATDRVISSRYMRAGMGDGGACHPRDNIALAALAQRYRIRGNYFLELIHLREQQSDFIADLAEHWSHISDLPIVILGRAYKKDIAMDDGSPAVLLAHGLTALGLEFTQVDPVMRPDDDGQRLEKVLSEPHVFVVATDHTAFVDLKYQTGSVVIDPSGTTKPQPGMTLVTPGRRRRVRHGVTNAR